VRGERTGCVPVMDEIEFVFECEVKPPVTPEPVDV
jgi:hypothetical protein